MSPTPNYYPDMTKLARIEGKKHFEIVGLFFFFSVWIWLILN